MGYVAELEQLDPVPPYAEVAAAAEPVTELLPVSASPAPALSPPAAPVLSRIRQLLQRRTLIAALAILIGSGLGYAGLRGSADAPRPPAVAAPSVPADGVLPSDPASPGAEPVTAGTTEPVGGGDGIAGPLSNGVQLPGLPDALDRAPVATAVPTQLTGPAPPEPAVAPAGPLTAVLSHFADGLLGYAGTIRVENPGVREVTGWQVTLTVPAGNAVTASGVSVVRDGDTVTFTPTGATTVPAGGAVTFSFEVGGLLAVLPGGCVINGRACA